MPRTSSIAIEGPASNAPVGNPLTDKRRRRISPSRTTGAKIQELWESNASDWEANLWYDIDECLYHMMGGSRFILPDDFLPNIKGRENMIVVFPQKMTIILKILGLLGNKKVHAMRYPVGLSMRADTTSTNIETWVEAALDHDVDGRPLVNYREIAGRLLCEGAVVIKVLSSDAHWRKSITWLDVVEEEEYDDMRPRRKRQYAPMDEVDVETDEDGAPITPWTQEGRRTGDDGPRRYVRVDEEGQPVPKRGYFRDAKGRARDHKYYQGKGKDAFTEDREQTLKAFIKEQKEWLSRRLPFEVEAISPRHCIPIMDDNERVEAILVAREYDAEELIGRDFIWGDNLAMLQPEKDGSVVVYELWHVDNRDRPYVAYFVDGYEYTQIRKKDNEGEILADAVIDLQREYGCTKLPIRWFWGLNFPVDDITQKGVPFLKPVLSAINAAEGIATATHIYAWRNAFSGNLIEINPAILDRYGDILMKNGEPLKWTPGPMEDRVVPGRPTPSASPPPGAGVQQLLQMLLQSAASMFPSEAVFGGGQAASGHDRALSKEYLEISLSQIMESARLAVKFVAEMILEYACWIADKTGRNVPVFANVPVSQASVSGQTKYQSQVVELSPSWLRSNFEVHTYYENDEADELKRAQLASQHMQGLVPWDQYRQEAWQDPAPEVTLAKIFGDQALRTPEGRQEVLEFAKTLWGDEQDQEKQKLIEEGLLSTDGVPTAARIPFTPRRLRQQGAPGAQPPLPGMPGGGAGAPGVPGGPTPGGPPPTGMAGAPGTGDLPPGYLPPEGVPASLVARHHQLDVSHAAAKALEAAAGPLGAIGGSANAGGVPVPLPGMAPGGPVAPVVPMVAPPPTSLPPGTQGATDIQPFPQQWAKAPIQPGMGSGGLNESEIMAALGGVLSGQLRKQAKNYHNRRRASGGLPKVSV